MQAALQVTPLENKEEGAEGIAVDFKAILFALLTKTLILGFGEKERLRERIAPRAGARPGPALYGPLLCFCITLIHKVYEPWYTKSMSLNVYEP